MLLEKKKKGKKTPSNPACIKVVLTLVSDSGLGGSIQRNPHWMCFKSGPKGVGMQIAQGLACTSLVSCWGWASRAHSSSYTDTSPLPTMLRWWQSVTQHSFTLPSRIQCISWSWEWVFPSFCSLFRLADCIARGIKLNTTSYTLASVSPAKCWCFIVSMYPTQWGFW